jgi:hypothetical protein
MGISRNFEVARVGVTIAQIGIPGTETGAVGERLCRL